MIEGRLHPGAAIMKVLWENTTKLSELKLGGWVVEVC